MKDCIDPQQQSMMHLGEDLPAVEGVQLLERSLHQTPVPAVCCSTSQCTILSVETPCVITGCVIKECVHSLQAEGIARCQLAARTLT